MIFLENEYIKATFAKKGAELQSLSSKKNSQSYMWTGDAAYWGKFSPVLFPIVGALKDNTYYFEGKKYNLPRHGFARDHEFEAFMVSPTEVVFKLSDTEETLKIYPFKFSLQLQYKLTAAVLSCTYEVSNPANTPLFFSIGAHPAFSVPLQQELSYEDYFLHFNKDAILSYQKIDQDLIADETEDIALADGKLHLKHELFYDDALVFKSLKSDCISLSSSKAPHGFHFRFKDFPFFGIWAAKNADFICLEPWCGIADGLNQDQNLKDKEGIVQLAPYDIWKRTWEIECF